MVIAGNQIGNNRLKQIFIESKSLHVFFWFLLALFLVIIDRSECNFITKIGKTCISILFYMIITYINWFVLIPVILKRKKWLAYIFSLLILACILTPPKSLSFYLLFENYPNIQQYFLGNQNLLLFESIFVSAVSSAVIITQEWIFQRKDMERQQLQSELNFLKSQINPHFFFNTLNNLYALTLKKSNNAPEMVLRLSEMMRYMLYECNEPKVPLEKEINYLKNYIELEKLRQSENFEIKMNIQGNPNGHKIAPLLFIPFVENSFKHGMSNQIHEGYVNIDLNIENKNLQLHIENSLAKLPTKISNKKSGGIGLINIKRRLELIYPKKHVLNTKKSDSKFTVDLNLSLNQYS